MNIIFEFKIYFVLLLAIGLFCKLIWGECCLSILPSPIAQSVARPHILEYREVGGSSPPRSRKFFCTFLWCTSFHSLLLRFLHCFNPGLHVEEQSFVAHLVPFAALFLFCDLKKWSEKVFTFHYGDMVIWIISTFQNRNSQSLHIYFRAFVSSQY